MSRLTRLALSLTGITTLLLSACSGGSATPPTAAPTSASTPAGSSPTATAVASTSQSPLPSATPRPTMPPGVTATVPPTRPPPLPSATPVPTTPPTATSMPLPPTGIQAGRYDWLDTSDLPAPEAAKISVTNLDGWRARVQGAAGSVAAGRPVLVACLDLPNGVIVRSDSQGGFSAEIYSPPGCTVQVKHDPSNRWLAHPDLAENQRPTEIGIPPAVLVSTNPHQPGSTSFSVAGRVANGLDPHLADFMVPYRTTGAVNTLSLTQGSMFSVSGTVKVLLPAGSTVPTTPPQLIIQLQSIADANGAFTGPHQKFGSVIKTPLGAPIERWQTGEPEFGASPESFQLTAGTNGEYTGTFQLSQPLPSSVPSGYYRISFTLNWMGAKWGTPAPGIKSEVANFAYSPDRVFGPTLKVGSPASPRLPIMLLPDAINNGSRGVEDPVQRWRSVQRITEPASYTVLPRLDAKGAPRAYRLEPAVPYLSNTDRGLAFAPIVAVRLPSGSISATVSGPQGSQTIGPTALVQTRSSTPATVGGLILDQGGGHLEDALELTTNSPAFRYVFPADGAYSIRVQGTVQDESGLTWSMDGTFKIVIGEQLDIDPGVLPGLPLKAGEKLPIGLQVDPGIPAQVEVEVRFAPNSETSRPVTRVFRGTANRYGYHFAGESVAFDTPGEYAVEYRATYESEGRVWAGVMAWNGVVADPGPSIVVHGRRGIDVFPGTSGLERFTRNQTGIRLEGGQTGTHINYPYHSGDVVLQTDDDSVQGRASFSDPSGALRPFFLGHPQGLALGLDGPATLAQRFDAEEAPFISGTTTGFDVTSDPAHTDLRAYFYSSATRPGERVRAGVTEDNTDTWYWRFLEQYAAQPGMGFEGDRPGDVKFQFLGGVIRTPQRNYYGRYASLWVELPDGTQPGSRVVAPLTENLLRAGGKDVRLFTILTLTKPGTVLEVGNTFGLAGQVGPTVSARVRVELAGPGNFRKSWDVQTNEIGQYYVADAVTKLDAPGIYTVTVAVTSGSTQGQLFDWSSFPLPVVPTNATLVQTNLPASGIATGLTVNVGVQTTNPVRALLTVPGWIVQDQERRPSGGATVLTLDAAALQQQYPFIDTVQPASPEPGLADSFVWVIMAGDGANLQVRRLVLQGPQLWHLG